MSLVRKKPGMLSFPASRRDKLLIAQAAKASGFTVPAFIAQTLVSRAHEVVQNESVIQPARNRSRNRYVVRRVVNEPVITLTESEWDNFTASLDRPAREPSEATKQAVELFKQGRDEGERQIW